MWARLHKLDRVRPLPNGGAIVLIEDQRTPPQMNRVPSISTLIAIARVLNARRALEMKFDGKGEVRYATEATPLPSFLSEAITRAGAAISDGKGEKITIPAQPSGVAALIDVAFSELAHHARGTIGIVDLQAALKQIDQRRRASPLDRDTQPELYWPAVLELAALVGEISRRQGGRWIETTDMPVPFALKFGENAIARPTQIAEKIVDGTAIDEVLLEPDGTPSASGVAPGTSAT